MTTAERCFIVTAHTLHMGKAAELLFSSQQAVSDNIRRLEKEHEVTLFYRKPKLALTPAGRILLNALERIDAIENNVKDDLRQLNAVNAGTLRFGMGSYRVHDSVVEMMVEFQRHYPDIRVDIIYEDTKILEDMVLNGDIDLMIGFNLSDREGLQKTLVVQEQEGIMGTDELLQRYLLPEEIEHYKRHGIPRDVFCSLPVIANKPTESLWSEYRKTFAKYNMEPHIIASSNDFSSILRLCSAGYGVSMCPLFLTEIIKKLNSTTNKFDPIHIIPFPELGPVNTIETAIYADRTVSTPLKVFTDIVHYHIKHPQDSVSM